MKLNKEFLLHNTNNESILVPTGNAPFSGVVQGNTTLGAVLELLTSEITEGELIAKMDSRYDAPAEIIEKDVKKVLQELRKIGALDE